MNKKEDFEEFKKAIFNKREILFRAKRIDNGEWVYGCYVYDNNGNHSIRDSGNEYIMVDKNTVGQFTGLTIKGQKVFEGDILKNKELENVLIPVFYTKYSFSIYPSSWEIIGNVYDNFNLIEEDFENQPDCEECSHYYPFGLTKECLRCRKGSEFERERRNKNARQYYQ